MRISCTRPKLHLTRACGTTAQRATDRARPRSVPAHAALQSNSGDLGIRTPCIPPDTSKTVPSGLTTARHHMRDLPWGGADVSLCQRVLHFIVHVGRFHTVTKPCGSRACKANTHHFRPKMHVTAALAVAWLPGRPKHLATIRSVSERCVDPEQANRVGENVFVSVPEHPPKIRQRACARHHAQPRRKPMPMLYASYP